MGGGPSPAALLRLLSPPDLRGAGWSGGGAAPVLGAALLPSGETTGEIGPSGAGYDEEVGPRACIDEAARAVLPPGRCVLLFSQRCGGTILGMWRHGADAREEGVWCPQECFASFEFATEHKECKAFLLLTNPMFRV